MRPIKGGRDKQREIIFTITLRVKKQMDVALAPDSASIYLQDERLELVVKKNPCVYKNDYLVAPMVYMALGEKTINKIINEAVKEAHLAEIEKKSCPNAMKEQLRKTSIAVTVEIEYPPLWRLRTAEEGRSEAKVPSLPQESHKADIQHHARTDDQEPPPTPEGADPRQGFRKARVH